MDLQKEVGTLAARPSLTTVRPLPEVHSCSTKEELLAHGNEVLAALEEFVRDLDPTILRVSGDPEGWSAARNVRHVGSTLRLVGRWLAMPRWLLGLLGRRRSPGPTIAEVRATNRPPKYDYGTYSESHEPDEELISKLLADLQRSASIWRRGVERRTTEELQTRRGLFGGMALGVFALFALKHAVHHLGVVRVRLSQRSTR